MPYDPQRHHRRSIRLPGYDYSRPGAYYVTICTHAKQPLFGRLVDGAVRLNPLGSIVLCEWQDLPTHFPHVQLDACVIMPNHLHAILTLTNDEDAPETSPAPIVRAGPRSAPPCILQSGQGSISSSESGRMQPAPIRKSKRRGLSDVICNFKSFSTRRINQFRRTPGKPVWHRNYWERIIRNPIEHDRIREYIANNPNAPFTPPPESHPAPISPSRPPAPPAP